MAEPWALFDDPNECFSDRLRDHEPGALARRSRQASPPRHPDVGYVQLTGPAYDLTASDPAGLVAQVTLQRKIPGVNGPLGWESVGRPRALSREVVAGPTVFFEGSLRIDPRAKAAGVRWLIEEFERLRADDRPGKRPRRIGLRPVFADFIEL